MKLHRRIEMRNYAIIGDLFRRSLDLAQTRHREMCLTDDLGREHLGIPIKFRQEPGVVRTVAPTLGEHASQILATLGRSASEIAQLRGEGVV